MTSMISAVSGYFTRGKLLSTILPALVFVILFLLLVDLPEVERWLRRRCRRRGERSRPSCFRPR